MPEDIEACVKALTGKPGIDNPHAMCNWMKQMGRQLPSEAPKSYEVVAEVYVASQDPRRSELPESLKAKYG